MLDLDCYTRNRIRKDAFLRRQNQIIFVYGKGSIATLLFYQKEKAGNWRMLLKTKANIGKNGLGKIKEGDGKTPIGIFSIGMALGREKRMKTKLPYVMIYPDLYWVDDPDSFYYNQLVDNCKVGKEWKTAEHLWDYTVEYEYMIEIKYNQERIPGKGSGIFLHCSNGGPTEGCISIGKEKVKYLIEHLEPEALIRISPFPR